MDKINKVSVAITREQHAKIKAAVERGDYATTGEVIRAALREWELKEELRRIENQRIARLWDEGIASGPARQRGIEGIVTEARARLGKLWDEGIASGQALEGPPAMERLRSKYQAMQKSPVSKKARNPKR